MYIIGFLVCLFFPPKKKALTGAALQQLCNPTGVGRADPKEESTHCCYEAIEGLPPLGVLDGDGTEVVSEPDGRDDSACVAVSNVLL